MFNAGPRSKRWDTKEEGRERERISARDTIFFEKTFATDSIKFERYTPFDYAIQLFETCSL